MVFRLTTAALTASAMAIALSVPVAAVSAADFYQGKTISIMVPSGLGASMGLYARLVGRALEKTIPGKPNIIVQSRPGAGGTKGTSYAFNVGPSDGTLIAQIASGNVTLPVLRKVKYDVTRFQWLGSVTERPSAIWLWHTSPVDKLNGAKTTQVILGSTGRGSGTYMWPTMINHMLGTRFKIVGGYKGGSRINQAAEQGEVHGRWTSYSGLSASKKQWLQKKLVNVIAQIGPYIPAQAQAPRIRDLVTGEFKAMVNFLELSERIGMGFWMRPEVPKARVEILRTAFMKAMSDPAVKAEGAKRGAPIDPIPGAKINKMVAEAYRTPKATLNKIKTILGFK
jgi:tripartite-type tricarboxylate transporter receptor subunit TctC